MLICLLKLKPSKRNWKKTEIIDWNVKRKLTGHTDWVFKLAISQEDLLISGSYDKSIKVWNIQTGECLNTLNGHTNYVFSLTISQDGLLISGSGYKSINVWEKGTSSNLDFDIGVVG